MTTVLGWRGTFGVLAPSTNTVVEADCARMAVPGVTCHVGRIHIRSQDLASDARFVELIQEIERELDAACERVLTCEPDHLLMGMSAETFWGGAEGNRRFTAHVEELTGMRVTTPAAACERALHLLGAGRIGVLTPYQPVGDENVKRFFNEVGFDVPRIIGLRCPTAASIARVPERRLREVLRELDGDDLDAIVQVGTNLSMVSLADEAERWLEKPVLAINAVTWWAALRDYGIGDRLSGAGCLLREH